MRPRPYSWSAGSRREGAKISDYSLSCSDLTDAEAAAAHMVRTEGNQECKVTRQSDLAQALRAVGFEVIEQRDATRETMAKAVRDFSERLRGADVALFFYSPSVQCMSLVPALS